MKKETHPKYQKVLFVDSASGHRFVCGSTLTPQGKEVFEGVEYPVYYLSISSTSHPLFTGSKQLVDSAGRVEKFNKRFDKKVAEDRAAALAQASKATQSEKSAAPAKKKK